MSRTYKYVESLDSMAWFSAHSVGMDAAASKSSFGMHSGSQLPVAQTGSIHLSDSRYGFSLTGPSVANLFVVPPAVFTEDYRTFSFKGKPLSMFNNEPPGGITTTFQWISIQGSGGQSVFLVLELAPNSSGIFKIQLRYSGTQKATSATLTASNYPADTIWTLQMDMVTVDGGAGQIRLLASYDNGGGWQTATIIGWTDGTTGGNTLDSTKTERLLSLGKAKIIAPGKGNDSNAQFYYSWLCTYGETTSAEGRDDTPLSEFFGIFAVYPKSDDSVGGWSASGNVAGCTQLWAALDDVEDDDDQADDYISESEGSDTDVLFVPGQIEANGDSDINSTNGTVECVAITAKCPESLAAADIKILQKQAGGTLQANAVVEDTYASSNGGDFWAILLLDSEGAAWDSGTNPEDKFNSSVFGLRSVGTAAGKCWGLVFHVVGENLVRPNAAQACVDAAARRRLALVV